MTRAPSERYPTPPLFGRLGQGANTHFCRSEQAQNQDRHNSNDMYADEPPTSPDLPYPAMGLTMGLMNAAAREAGAGMNGSNSIQRRLRQEERQRCCPTLACIRRIGIAWYDEQAAGVLAAEPSTRSEQEGAGGRDGGWQKFEEGEFS